MQQKQTRVELHFAGDRCALFTAGNAIVNTTETTLAKKFSWLPSKLGLTPEPFAAKVGVTCSTVNRWESAKSRSSPLAMRRIQELLETAPNSPW